MVHKPPFSTPSPESSLNSMCSLRTDVAPLSLESPSDEDADRELNQDNAARSSNEEGRAEASQSNLFPSNALGHMCLLSPSPSTFETFTPRPTSPIHPAAENNLLAEAWYFAARATHVPNQKVGKVARRLILRIAKVLRDEPHSLEIARDVVSQCHRTQAEGLLDRVYKAREKVSGSHAESRSQPLGGENNSNISTTPGLSNKTERSSLALSPLGFQQSKAFGEKRESPGPQKSGLTLASGRAAKYSPEPNGFISGRDRKRSECGSDDSYRSAMSDLSLEEAEEKREEDGGGGGRGRERERESRKGRGKERGTGGESPGAASSGASVDSRSEDSQSKGSASGSSGGKENMAALPG